MFEMVLGLIVDLTLQASFWVLKKAGRNLWGSTLRAASAVSEGDSSLLRRRSLEANVFASDSSLLRRRSLVVDAFASTTNSDRNNPLPPSPSPSIIKEPLHDQCDSADLDYLQQLEREVVQHQVPKVTREEEVLFATSPFVNAECRESLQ